MKFFWLPTGVLALLLGLSLWNAAAVKGLTEPWCASLARAEASAERGDWDAAESILSETRADWEARHPYFHIVTAHDELDEADALFAQAESFAAERDEGELRASLAALAVQLRVIAEMQQLTLKNVL